MNDSDSQNRGLEPEKFSWSHDYEKKKKVKLVHRIFNFIYTVMLESKLLHKREGQLFR